MSLRGRVSLEPSEAVCRGYRPRELRNLKQDQRQVPQEVKDSTMNRPHISIWKSANCRTIWICLWFVLGIMIGANSYGDDAEKEKSPAAEPVKPANQKQLKTLFQELFGPRKNGNPPRNPRRFVPGDSPIDSGNARDPIDSRAPRDARIEQLLQTADTAAKKKEFKNAIDLYQRLLDQSEDSLSRSTSGKWQSIRQTVNERLGQLPEATLAEYRTQYGGLAQQQLQAARRSGLAADFVGVATRFFHTPAGYEAAQFLASQHFDKSEFELAARWFSELAASPAAVTRRDTWLLQAAYALLKAGDLEGANKLVLRLSGGPDTKIPLGAGTVKASEFLSQASQAELFEKRSLSDWTQIYGTAARTGTAIGGDPLLSPNWTIPLTASHAVRNSLKWLAHDLLDQQRALVLAAQPLVVDGRVIYRDLRGLRCVDIHRGETIWDGIEGVSPERILSGYPAPQPDMQENWRFQANPFPNQNDYQGMSAEYSPLASLLFRDGTYGLISSDGDRVFVVEDYGVLSSKQPGQNWGWDGNADHQDAYGVPWKTNRLAAYDLRSGRALWSIGGLQSNESFDLPLAGSFIHGVPAVDGNELFLIASKGEEVRLWVLDSKLGQPKWSQLIAFSDTKIDLDLARRWIPAEVAVSHGMVVCPTAVGWTIAIDRMRQSVLWAYRYSPRETNNGDRDAGVSLLVQRDLNGTWCPSAPVISDSRVVFTPQDEPILVCLSAIDGRLLWQKPKGLGLYLAGVFDQKVIIVGESDVLAYRLEDGEPAWTANIESGVRPSGRSLVVEDRIYLPLSSGELRVIDLKNGNVISKTYVASMEPPLGNLAMHRGQLVSLGLFGLTKFGQRDAVFDDIQLRLAADPEDATALLRSSEIQLMNRNYAAALPLLRRIQSDRLVPAERERQRAALVDCLSASIRKEPILHNDELDELGRIVTSPSEVLLYHNLIAERLLGEKRSADAFEQLSQLAIRISDEPLVAPDDRELKLRPVVWISGRLSEIWMTAIDAERQRIDERIAMVIQQTPASDPDALQRVSTLFAFHSSGMAIRERFVEQLIEANDLAGARIELERLAELSDKSAAARAIERLARMMAQSQHPMDAAHYYGLLETEFAEIPVRDGKTGKQLVESVRATHEIDFEPRLHGAVWKANPLQLEQSMINYAPPSLDVPHVTNLPFFGMLSLEYYQHEQRMSFESTSTGQVEWMVPLHGALRVADDGYLTASHIGHQIFFVNRGVLHAISPLEKRVLWTKTLDNSGEGSIQLRNDSRQLITPMTGPGRDDSAPSLLLQRSMSMGNLNVIQPDYLCLYGRRTLSILDPRTGEQRWQRDALPVNAQVVGNRDAVFVTNSDRNDAVAYRIADGKSLDMPGLGRLLRNALLASGSSFLLFEQPGSAPLAAFGIRSSKSTKYILRMYDPIARKTDWHLEYPAGTVVSPLGTSEVIVARADGQVERVNAATGKVSLMEAVPKSPGGPKRPGQLQEKYLLADDDRIYLIANEPDLKNHWFGESLASVRTHGTIYTYSRRDNRLLWSQPIDHQNLVVDRFSAMPVLLFVSRSLRQQRPDIGALNVKVLHKQTGRILLDTKIASTYSGFHALDVKPEVPSIELKSYNGRLRLLPIDEAGEVESQK